MMRFLIFILLLGLVAAGVRADKLPIETAIQNELGADVSTTQNWSRIINRGIFIVPVYRELYNENLGYFLNSLAIQEQRAKYPVRLEVVFIVNNTTEVPEGVRTENIESVAFLNELSQGRRPTIRPTSLVLKSGIESVVNSSIRIHVLDHTSPGFTLDVYKF
jgi:hypothetical protein